MSNESAQLIGRGLFMGIVHVLTGPDHLSALATLSANVGNCKAFAYGVRWGVGHSTGLIVVASILIAVRKNNEEKLDLSDKLDHILESCVGVFMVFLGCYSWYRAIQKHKEQANSDAVRFVDGEILLPSSQRKGHTSGTRFGSMTSMATVNLDDEDFLTEDADEEEGDEAEMTGSTEGSKNVTPDVDKDTIKKQKSSIEYLNAYRVGLDVKFVDPKESETIKTKFLACGIGILHGVAGPGGALGVIPAVKLQQWSLSAFYLGFFCLASIVTMGIFAALYGILTKFLASKTHFHFQIECFSSCLSILVGVTWLYLLAIGKLNDIFP